MIKLSRDIGIDLGTANVLVYLDGKGIVVNEPSAVALDKNTGKVLEVGAAAKKMLGRTPGNIVAARPLERGAISDYDMTATMLSVYLRRITKMSLVKPRVVVSVPSGITEVEERAVIQAAMEAGARRVYLIEEPLAAAIGAGMDIKGAGGSMVIDIGGGTTDIAVLSLNNVVRSTSIDAAGDAFDNAHYPVYSGALSGAGGQPDCGGDQNGPWLRQPQTGSAGDDGKRTESFHRSAAGGGRHLCGCDARTDDPLPGYPLCGADDSGKDRPGAGGGYLPKRLTLTGGGSLLYGFDQLIYRSTGIACHVADDSILCVALGCGKSLKWIDEMQEGTVNYARQKLMQE